MGCTVEENLKRVRIESTSTYLIVGILQKEKLALVKVLHTLFAPHKL